MPWSLWPRWHRGATPPPLPPEPEDGDEELLVDGADDDAFLAGVDASALRVHRHELGAVADDDLVVGAHMVEDRHFSALMAEAIDALREEVVAMLDNVAILLADEPSPEQRQSAGLEDGEELLGLYDGVPLTEGGDGLPATITLFRGPLMRTTPDDEELVEQIQITLVHEIGHHAGIGEERLDELGWA